MTCLALRRPATHFAFALLLLVSALQLSGQAPEGRRGYYSNPSLHGDTVIFNERFDRKGDLTVRKRVSPARGKAVVFDSNTWHASSNPRVHSNRIVLNFCFSVK